MLPITIIHNGKLTQIDEDEEYVHKLIDESWTRARTQRDVYPGSGLLQSRTRIIYLFHIQLNHLRGLSMSEFKNFIKRCIKDGPATYGRIIKVVNGEVVPLSNWDLHWMGHGDKYGAAPIDEFPNSAGIQDIRNYIDGEMFCTITKIDQTRIPTNIRVELHTVRDMIPGSRCYARENERGKFLPPDIIVYCIIDGCARAKILWLSFVEFLNAVTNAVSARACINIIKLVNGVVMPMSSDDNYWLPSACAFDHDVPIDPFAPLTK